MHDTTDHEQDDLSTAYTRSLETLERYEQRFDLYIDLHRDAYIEGVESIQLYDESDQSLAQLMLLIGNGEGFDVKPYYEENLRFAEALTERINARKSGLCKDVLVKDGRYNQNIGVFSVLIEVGHNRNTLLRSAGLAPLSRRCAGIADDRRSRSGTLRDAARVSERGGGIDGSEFAQIHSHLLVAERLNGQLRPQRGERLHADRAAQPLARLGAGREDQRHPAMHGGVFAVASRVSTTK